MLEYHPSDAAREQRHARRNAPGALAPRCSLALVAPLPSLYTALARSTSSSRARPTTRRRRGARTPSMALRYDAAAYGACLSSLSTSGLASSLPLLAHLTPSPPHARLPHAYAVHFRLAGGSRTPYHTRWHMAARPHGSIADIF